MALEEGALLPYIGRTHAFDGNGDSRFVIWRARGEYYHFCAIIEAGFKSIEKTVEADCTRNSLRFESDDEMIMDGERLDRKFEVPMVVCICSHSSFLLLIKTEATERGLCCHRC